MKAKLRSLSRDFLVYGLGDAVVKASGLITLPIFTRLFTPGEYGVWNLTMTIAGFLSGTLALGGTSAYARFYFEAKTVEKKQDVASTWLIFLLIWSLFIALLSIPLSQHFSEWTLGTPRYKTIFMLSLLTVPILMINIHLGQMLRNQFLAGRFSLLNILSTLLSVLLSLYAIITLHLGLIGLAGGVLIASSVMVPIRLWSVRKMLKPSFSVEILKKMLSYGLPLVPMSIAYWIFGTSDRIVLGRLSTPEQLGLYGVANNLTAGLIFLSGSLGQAWSPHAIEVYEDHPQHAPSFFNAIFVSLLGGFGILCIALTLFSREILFLLSTPPFYGAAAAIGPLALGVLGLASTHVTALVISLKKQTHRFVLISWIAAFLNIFLNILLVPRWGMIASSWTTAASCLFLTLAYGRISQKLYPIPYQGRRIFVFTMITLTFTAGTPYLMTHNLFLTLFIKVISLLGYIGLIFSLKFLKPQALKSGFQLFYREGKKAFVTQTNGQDNGSQRRTSWLES